MAPTRTVRSKVPAKSSTKGSSRTNSKSSNVSGSRISKSSKSKAPISKPKQVKTKAHTTPVKKKKRTYTAEELGVPTLNGIVPAGVIKPKGKKKGKVFVDDEEQMMTILAIVNAEAEGRVEGKMVRQRKLEEVREARRVEAEKKEKIRMGKLENVKDEIRSQKKRSKKNLARIGEMDGKVNKKETIRAAGGAGVPRKRVSFAG